METTALAIMLPLILLVSMAPISIAGWGVREGAMIVALALVGVSDGDALALSVLFGLALLVIGVIGGVVWILSGDALGGPNHG